MILRIILVIVSVVYVSVSLPTPVIFVVDPFFSFCSVLLNSSPCFVSYSRSGVITTVDRSR